MPNSLTREVGLKVGPVMLEVLVKRWFDCLKKDEEDSNPDSGTRLKENDIVYHQSFTIAKVWSKLIGSRRFTLISVFI
jgi:hypothetical protein